MSALRIAQILLILAAPYFLAACASSPQKGFAGSASPYGAQPGPYIIASGSPSQCVPYARAISNIQIRGDAWTWWQAAQGQYDRSNRPQVGSVMVLSKTSRLHYGHLAVVTAVLSDREILVEHANWLNQGRIHKNQIVRDVSARGDWSEVRLWYTPGNTLGVTVYPVSGFVSSGSPRYVRAAMS